VVALTLTPDSRDGEEGLSVQREAMLGLRIFLASELSYVDMQYFLTSTVVVRFAVRSHSKRAQHGGPHPEEFLLSTPLPLRHATVRRSYDPELPFIGPFRCPIADIRGNRH
jgi:hypothetical protein